MAVDGSAIFHPSFASCGGLALAPPGARQPELELTQSNEPGAMWQMRDAQVAQQQGQMGQQQPGAAVAPGSPVMAAPPPIANRV